MVTVMSDRIEGARWLGSDRLHRIVRLIALSAALSVW